MAAHILYIVKFYSQETLGVKQQGSVIDHKPEYLFTTVYNSVDGLNICEVSNPLVDSLLTLWLASHYVFNIV